MPDLSPEERETVEKVWLETVKAHDTSRNGGVWDMLATFAVRALAAVPRLAQPEAERCNWCGHPKCQGNCPECSEMEAASV